VPCSLHLRVVLAGQQRRDQHRQPLQIGHGAHRRRPGRLGGRLEIGPLGGDQALGAVGQDQQQLETAMPTHLTQLLQRLPLERMTDTGDHHRVHRPTP
jgi:hypothetical protein